MNRVVSSDEEGGKGDSEEDEDAEFGGFESSGPNLGLNKTTQRFSGDDRSVFFHPDRKTLARDLKELIQNKDYTELAKMKAIAEEFERIPNLKQSIGNFGQSNIEYDDFLENFNFKQIMLRRNKLA